MPLVNMDRGQEIGRRRARQPVLVFQDGDHSMGLMVDEIVDIVEARLNVELGAELPGRIGSAVVAGQATEIIDTGYFLRQAYADWFGSHGPRRTMGDRAQAPAAGRRQRLLPQPPGAAAVRRRLRGDRGRQRRPAP